MVQLLSSDFISIFYADQYQSSTGIIRKWLAIIVKWKCHVERTPIIVARALLLQICWWTPICQKCCTVLYKVLYRPASRRWLETAKNGKAAGSHEM
eukprot:scaffold7548_cov106-Skeletonema_marinoi.AAC.6